MNVPRGTLDWIAALVLAGVLIGAALLTTRVALGRRRDNINPVAWVLIASVAGGSMSATLLVLL